MRRLLPLSLTFDHRVVMGGEATRFLNAHEARLGGWRHEARNRITDDPFRFTDDLGPVKIVHITERTTGLRATVVIDNVAIGQAIGGVRMAPDVTTEECFRLARAMTLKNAAAGLHHGGGKAVIVGDPLMPLADKEPLIRAFADAIEDLTDYVPGPDMGTDETCMAWIHDQIGRAIGLPTRARRTSRSTSSVPPATDWRRRSTWPPNTSGCRSPGHVSPCRGSERSGATSPSSSASAAASSSPQPTSAAAWSIAAGSTSPG